VLLEPPLEHGQHPEAVGPASDALVVGTGEEGLDVLGSQLALLGLWSVRGTGFPVVASVLGELPGANR
jgi:hypothetical protein